MDQKKLFRSLPSVNDLLNSDKIMSLEAAVGANELKNLVQEVIEDARQLILSGDITNAGEVSVDCMYQELLDKLDNDRVLELQPVINATGVILHTNLGRAKLAESARKAIDAIASNATNLEYDITLGERGDRYKAIGKLVSELTGADDAIVVNNNAAAVMLVLSTFFSNKEIITSRGQLVEIGGSFRVPDIITSTGGILREVGTTNKTHLRDYENAINENTGGFLIVHTSNYKVIGFTETPDSKDLKKLSEEYDLPLMNDLGSGLMLDLSKYGLGKEPTISQELKNCDLVMFSGDKLLGGPQAGIIAGKQEYIDKLKHNQLLRALRVDKMTLSALTATLKIYRDPDKAMKEIPVLNALTVSEDKLKERAEELLSLIKDKTQFNAEIIAGDTVVGGGSFPDVKLPTYLISLESDIPVVKLDKLLKYAKYPLISRVHDESILFDIRTIDDPEFEKIIIDLNSIKA
ncbi:L-seryl-tRNA(Sec) selenium transferase [Companilactobacillus baiquanensis]|uniref:L-seryl-tRNA(Sec) selenium transferase n=1 Tax=Companilactobacillus baiquanensis TaxID=2486005 RepID=A0ABW1UTI7_9LACO|nr:L-seryl-tRNA(Sec) selenium transferase [Companilactobacillus baiquanensis]